MAKFETHCTCFTGQGHRTGKHRLLMQLWEHPICHLVVFSAQDVGQKLKRKANVQLILHLVCLKDNYKWTITALKEANLKPTSSLHLIFLSWTLPFHEQKLLFDLKISLCCVERCPWPDCTTQLPVWQQVIGKIHLDYEKSHKVKTMQLLLNKEWGWCTACSGHRIFSLPMPLPAPFLGLSL